jgi:hypothetical protein
LLADPLFFPWACTRANNNGTILVLFGDQNFHCLEALAVPHAIHPRIIFSFIQKPIFKIIFVFVQGVSKKCTPFQIQISHNLLNIRCSAVSWPILYLKNIE